MIITNINIRLLKTPKTKIRAIASVTFDESLIIHDFKIIESVKGFFVSMPAKKINETTFQDIVQPLTTQMNDLLQRKILRAFQDELARPEKLIGQKKIP